jgi:hypothetical protein
MKFFKGHENLGCRKHGSGEQLFVILAAWKCDSCRVVKSSTPLQLPSYLSLLEILVTWKVLLHWSWDPRIKGVLLSLIYCTVFWRPENAIP